MEYTVVASPQTINTVNHRYNEIKEEARKSRCNAVLAMMRTAKKYPLLVHTYIVTYRMTIE